APRASASLVASSIQGQLLSRQNIIPRRQNHRSRRPAPESVGVTGGSVNSRSATVQTKHHPRPPEPLLPPSRPESLGVTGGIVDLRPLVVQTKHHLQLSKPWLPPSRPRERRNHGGIIDLSFNMISNHLNHPCRCSNPESVSIAGGIINLRPHVVDSVVHTLYVCFALYRNSLLIFPYKSSPPAIRVPQQHPLVTKLAQLEKEVKEQLKKKDVQKEEAEY
ncbi:hypothetical protein K438DRAFT_1771807, partial [Mycena galopus ATCC 62051]